MPTFVILAHRSAGALSDLFRFIHAPANDYILHIDAKAPPALHALGLGLAAAFPNVHLLTARYCSWGGFSLVEAALAGIRDALTRPGFGHFIMLSEQHLPLRRAAEITAGLVPGVSDIQLQPVAMMDEAGRADVLERFADLNRELPGVGSFATARRGTLPAIEIYHGSQWMILDEAMCRIMAATHDPAFWALFATSLLADETALQTIAAAAQQAGARICGRNRSWIATPERVGNHQMMFNAPHFFTARDDEKYLFIRKRPDILPDAVREVLEAEAAFSAFELTSILARHEVNFTEPKKLLSPTELALHLRWHLTRTQPDLAIEVLTPPVNAPACYIRLSSQQMPARLSLLSEDLRHFKIIVAVPHNLAGHANTSRIRARVYDLADWYEIHLPHAPDHGFVTLADAHDLRPLLSSLRFYLSSFAA